MLDGLPLTERGRVEARPITTLKSEELPRDISTCSSRYSRSSSISSYAHSDFSEASAASTATSFSEHPLDQPDSDEVNFESEDLEIDLVNQTLSWQHQHLIQSQATHHQDLGDVDDPDPHRPWTSPLTDDQYRPPPPPPPLSGSPSEVIRQRGTFHPYSSICPKVHDYRGSFDAHLTDQRDLSAAYSLRAISAATDHAQRPSFPVTSLTSSSEGSTPQSLYGNLSRSGLAPTSEFDIPPPPYLKYKHTAEHYDGIAEPSRSQEHFRPARGQQRLSHPRRTRTDPFWQKPPLVRQENRRKSYVNNLVGELNLFRKISLPYAYDSDVAVSFLSFIWPSSQRAMRVKHGKVGPCVINLRYFVEQILRRSYASHSTLQVALYYCFMLHVSGVLHPGHPAQANKQQALPLMCGRRMFLASLMLAFKFLQDRNYSSRAWSTISGLSLKDINGNEAALLRAIDYQTFVRDDAYQYWQRLINDCAESAKDGLAISWQTVLDMMRGAQATGNVFRVPAVPTGILVESDEPMWHEPTSRRESESHSGNACSLRSFSGLPTPSPSPPEVAESVEPNEAASVPVPESPDAIGPVAPPAPRMGTCSPPKIPHDEKVFDLNVTYGNLDNDSGYDSTSPVSTFTNYVLPRGTGHKAFLSDTPNEDDWRDCGVIPDGDVATDSSRLQHAVAEKLQFDLPDRSKVAEIRPDDADEGYDSDDQPSFYQSQFPSQGGSPSANHTHIDGATTRMIINDPAADDPFTFYETHHEQLGQFEENADRQVEERQNKKKQSSLSKKRPRACGDNPGTVQKKTKIGKGKPSKSLASFHQTRQLLSSCG